MVPPVPGRRPPAWVTWMRVAWQGIDDRTLSEETMKRFQFKLEPLLRQRKHAERERQRELALLDRRRFEIENQIRSHQRRIVAGKHELGAHLRGRIDTNAIRTHAAMTLQLDANTRLLVLQLSDLYKQIRGARELLIEALKRRKAIEHLRQRRFEAWKYEMDRQEANELDDMVTTRRYYRDGGAA